MEAPYYPPPEELEYSFFRSSGPGGQKKNTTDSSVRLRHLPTGLVVIATASRSQHRNRELALEELARRLEVMRRVPKHRTATRPTAASRRRRLETKRIRSRTKQLRSAPPDGE